MGELSKNENIALRKQFSEGNYMANNITVNKTLRILIPVVAIPLVIILGIILLNDRQYAFISFAVAILASVPFFMVFENRGIKGKSNTRRLVILATMVTISVLGRFIFAVIPFFKPVTAIVIVVAIYFGSEMGFMCGALSALISNFYFMQGPWTPFQMFAWGFIGLLAGLLSKYLKDNPIYLSIFGVFAALLFSLAMDIWVGMGIDGAFDFSRYIAAIVTSAPATLIYAISNIVFLLLLTKPIGKKLERIKVKYGV
jgi:energy-coupling factor transport system substrate-specific component